MAPPDKNKHDMAAPDGDSDDRRLHPCDGSGSVNSPSAEDQDHKACDEYPQGESIENPLLFFS